MDDLPLAYKCGDKCGMSICSRPEFRLEALRVAYVHNQNEIGDQLTDLEEKEFSLVSRLASNEREYKARVQAIENEMASTNVPGGKS